MNINDLSNFQISVIKSTVGINKNVNQNGDFYRNRFIADPTVEHEWPEIFYMINDGLYKEVTPDIVSPYKYIQLTEKGLELAKKIEQEVYS